MSKCTTGEYSPFKKAHTSSPSHPTSLSLGLLLVAAGPLLSLSLLCRKLLSLSAVRFLLLLLLSLLSSNDISQSRAVTHTRSHEERGPPLCSVLLWTRRDFLRQHRVCVWTIHSSSSSKAFSTSSSRPGSPSVLLLHCRRRRRSVSERGLSQNTLCTQPCCYAASSMTATVVVAAEGPQAATTISSQRQQCWP